MSKDMKLIMENFRGFVRKEGYDLDANNDGQLSSNALRRMADELEQGATGEEGSAPSVIPVGFSSLKNMAWSSMEAKSDFEFLQKQNPKPGTYNANNGSIVIIPADGVQKASVYIGDTMGGRADDERQVPYAQALKSVEDAGYKRAEMYVPFSNLPGSYS